MFEILAKFFQFSGEENSKKFKLSIGIGLLVAYPITEYLFEIEHLSKKLSIMLGTEQLQNRKEVTATILTVTK